ncbi:hypothetical protein DL766_010069 [Monosporascus sp. MC13-8B]|nr:hypothetical protein DL763_009873 [Monosporascus cannonballus]RYP11077.1 hypothetical protein DL766_010069 [Monosporascus sp. MC13-8B]
MTTAPPSPRRRHILSSINPERPPITKDGTTATQPAAPPEESRPDIDADAGGDEEHAAEEQRKRTSKFRFKSKHPSSHRSSRRHRDLEDDDDREHDSSTNHGHHRHRRDHGHDHDHDHDHDHGNGNDCDHDRHHHRRHRHKRRKRHRHRSRTRSPTPPNPYDPPPLSPDAAFRASLFDAMADDEGAAYWEAVYGQPLHVYPRGQQQQQQRGELEEMDDEEYAAYVRRRMWEKTHEGLLEERARREEARRAREGRERDARRLAREMEDSLRRGEERRARRRWHDRWEAYRAAWAEWAVDDQDQDDEDRNAGAGDEEESGQKRQQRLADVDPAWPVESGRRADVTGRPGAVREFLVRGLDAAAAAREGEDEGKREVGETEAFLAALKDERVRWHPDKIQQRLGGRVDGAVMRDVTAVFQIVDGLWSDARERCKKGRRGGLI